MISTFYKKKLFKPWILIPVSSKSGEKWGSYGRLKTSIWPTLSRHFEVIYMIQKRCSFVDKESGLLKVNANYQLVCL